MFRLRRLDLLRTGICRGLAANLLKILVRQLVMRIDLQGALKMHVSFREIASLRKRTAQVGFGIGVVWAKPDGGPSKAWPT